MFRDTPCLGRPSCSIRGRPHLRLAGIGHGEHQAIQAPPWGMVQPTQPASRTCTEDADGMPGEAGEPGCKAAPSRKLRAHRGGGRAGNPPGLVTSGSGDWRVRIDGFTRTEDGVRWMWLNQLACASRRCGRASLRFLLCCRSLPCLPGGHGRVK